MSTIIEYHCPYCFFLPLYEIDQEDFKSIKIKCPNNHLFEYKIFEFLKTNPFQNRKINCNHCSSSQNNIQDLFYCIECKKYSCKKDIFNYHLKCRKIITIQELFSTCFEHKSPLIALCKTCSKEICSFCIMKNHRYHLLSEKIQNLYEKQQLLTNDESLEKIFIEKLISEFNHNEMKPKYQYLIKIYDFLKQIFFYEISNQRFSTILYLNIYFANSAIYKFKKKIKIFLNINEKKSKILENKLLNEFLPSFKLFLENDIFNINNVLYNKNNNFFISIIKQDENEIVIKIQKHKEIKYLNIKLKDLEFDSSDFESFQTHNIIYIKSKNSTAQKQKPLTKFFNDNIKDVLKDKKHNKANLNLSFNLMENNRDNNFDYDFSSPEKKNYDKGKYILLENNYCLLLITIKNKCFENNDLLLISPDYNYKKMLTFNSGIIHELYIYPIYKNIFSIFVKEENKQIFFLEFFPEKRKIEVISKIYYEENNNFEIFESFEFNNKYCIFVTDIGILFYDWKKTQIIRNIKFKLEKSIYKQSILVNKFYLVGICNNSIFVYNFLTNKLYEYPSNGGLFSYFKNNNYKYISNIYDNYFISWNDFYYYLINVIPKGLKFIKKGDLNINPLKNNNTKIKYNIDDDRSNSSNSNNDDDSGNESEYSYNESDNEGNESKKQLFTDEDFQKVFGGSLFNFAEKTNLFDNNEFKKTFPNSLFDKKDNINKENEKSNNLNEGLFGNIKNQSNSLFGNLNNLNGVLFGNINSQSNNLLENSNNTNGSLFGISNANENQIQKNQSGGLFGNINNKSG